MYLFDLFIPNWFVLLAIIAFLLYKWAVANYHHFLNLGVDHDKPIPFFGSFLKAFLSFNGQPKTWIEQYEKYKHKSFFGVYEQRKPILVVNDPNLIRQIFVIDSDHFMHNGGMFNTKYIFKHSVAEISFEKWIEVRKILEQCLSQKSISYMFNLKGECSIQLIKNLKKQAPGDSSVRVDIFLNFAEFFTDMLTTMTFGMRSNNLSNNDNIFLNNTLKSFPNPYLYLLTYLLDGNFPWITELLRIRLINNNFVSYFNTLVRDIIAYRQEHNITHTDIANILLNYTSASPNNDDDTSKISLTDDEIISQCLIILFSGFAKCSILATSAAVELAANPETQAKLQREIDNISEKMDGSILTYDLLDSMEYLDMVINETLRKRPGAFTIDRICTKRYELVDNSNRHSIWLQPGDIICIPIIGLYQDAEIFPEPHRFDPERFSCNRRGFIRPYTFLPFGLGERNCFGAKFGRILVKAALVTLFSEFDVKRMSGKVGDILPDDSIHSPYDETIRILKLKRRKKEK